MRFSQLSYLAALAGSQLAAGQAHGEGLQGTVMGPVAFLWPKGRPWSAETDNTGPCGSPSGPTTRTNFPLSQGTVSLSIADEAWNVNFNIAYDNTPSIQSQFSHQAVSGIDMIEPGHQCYKISDIPSDIQAGTNATIQLEYWSNMDNELDGRNQTFYSCADITLVETESFNFVPSCFNVTASTFNTPTTSSTPAPSSEAGGANADAQTPTASSGGDGLSAGAKAGIAVGVIVASLAIVGAVAFAVLRKRKTKPADHEAAAGAKGQPEVSSVHSRQ
ncbi:hypothetical protein GGS23DRAFT_597701 [Durotheca rogersii]|uniref:uncharacterized protein n=1 Tax=Durotheca rogersii TaxID=419775 RepID=UPI00222084E8|nr:uncharacterized protein GGS23DRAFT_597701 [Durotheca rogersii]KAI5862077.1 hypothetical protein GGS23DRAFT_597701 [Durotheca rogersii]